MAKKQPPSFDVLAFVTEEPPRRGGTSRWVFDADALYPAALAAIVAGVRSATPDHRKYDELLDQVAADGAAIQDALAGCGEQEVQQSQQVTVGGTPLPDGAIAGGKIETRLVTVQVPQLPCEMLPADRVLARARVLHIVRKWVTNELHHAVGGGPIEIYWPNQPRWKLGLPEDVLADLERRV